MPVSVRDDQVRYLVDGLAAGLTRYYGQPIQVAAAIQVAADSAPETFGHATLLAERGADISDVLSDHAWPVTPEKLVNFLDGQEEEVPAPPIPGLVGFAIQSRPMFGQIWYASEPTLHCSLEPGRQFLLRAAKAAAHLVVLSHLYPERSPPVALGALAESFGYELESFEAWAVRLAILQRFDESFRDESDLPILRILRTLEQVSRIREEGARANGVIAFMESPDDAPNLAAFDSRPLFNPAPGASKRIRKLLYATTYASATDSVEHSSALISNGYEIFGLSSGPLPRRAVIARFRRGRVGVEIDGKSIAYIIDGRFNGQKSRWEEDDLRANLEVTVARMEGSGEALRLDEITPILHRVIEAAQERRHGCILVIDPTLSDGSASYAGERFSPPLDPDRHPAAVVGMARIDGALVFDGRGRLHAAACLLDGDAAPKREDRAHGARHNSCDRFTRSREGTLAIVVSEDGPISIYPADPHGSPGDASRAEVIRLPLPPRS